MENKTKYYILITVSLLIVVFGFYLFKTEKPEVIEPKFFSPTEILASDIIIIINENNFEPSEVTIKRGERVVFINDSSNYSWPASDPHPIHTDYPEFDPKEPLKNGEAWASVFDKAGVWKYHDHLKPQRKGVIDVSL